MAKARDLRYVREQVRIIVEDIFKKKEEDLTNDINDNLTKINNIQKEIMKTIGRSDKKIASLLENYNIRFKRSSTKDKHEYVLYILSIAKDIVYNADKYKTIEDNLILMLYKFNQVMAEHPCLFTKYFDNYEESYKSGIAFINKELAPYSELVDLAIKYVKPTLIIPNKRFLDIYSPYSYWLYHCVYNMKLAEEGGRLLYLLVESKKLEHMSSDEEKRMRQHLIKRMYYILSVITDDKIVTQNNGMILYEKNKDVFRCIEVFKVRLERLRIKYG